MFLAPIMVLLGQYSRLGLRTYIVDGLLIRQRGRWYRSFNNKPPTRPIAFIVNVEQRSDPVTTFAEDTQKSDVATHAPKKASHCNCTLSWKKKIQN